MNQDIKIGSLSVTTSSHELLSNLVYDNQKPTEDRPFSSIVEAFRFAFALGYSTDKRSSRKGSTETISPRNFVVQNYEVILREVCLKEGLSLGGLCSDYAEAGCKEIEKTLSKGLSVLDLID